MKGVLATSGRDVCVIVNDYRKFERKRAKNTRAWQVRLFPASSLGESMDIDVLRLFPKIHTRNQFLIVTTDRYPIQTGAVATSKTIACQTTSSPKIIESYHTG